MITEVQNINIDPVMIDKVEHNTELILKSQLNKLIYKSQKDFNVDFIGFSNKIYNTNPGLWSSMKKDWQEIFPDIKYEINIKINLHNVGMINDPATTNDNEEISK